MAIEKGTVLRGFHDEYRIEGVLGTGQYAVVYRARARGTGRPVVVKVSRPPQVDDGRGRTRVISEAAVLTRLKTITKAKAAVLLWESLSPQPEGEVHVEEWAEGTPLHHLLKQGPLPEEDFLTIAQQFCQLLEALASHGIAYRDVKLDHIFWDGRQIKVIDWNIAVLDADEEMIREDFHRFCHLLPQMCVGEEGNIDAALTLTEEVDSAQKALSYGTGLIVRRATELGYEGPQELREALEEQIGLFKDRTDLLQRAEQALEEDPERALNYLHVYLKREEAVDERVTRLWEEMAGQARMTSEAAFRSGIQFAKRGLWDQAIESLEQARPLMEGEAKRWAGELCSWAQELESLGIDQGDLKEIFARIEEEDWGGMAEGLAEMRQRLTTGADERGEALAEAIEGVEGEVRAEELAVRAEEALTQDERRAIDLAHQALQANKGNVRAKRVKTKAQAIEGLLGLGKHLEEERDYRSAQGNFKEILETWEPKHERARQLLDKVEAKLAADEARSSSSEEKVERAKRRLEPFLATDESALSLYKALDIHLGQIREFKRHLEEAEEALRQQRWAEALEASKRAEVTGIYSTRPDKIIRRAKSGARKEAESLRPEIEELLRENAFKAQERLELLDGVVRSELEDLERTVVRAAELTTLATRWMEEGGYYRDSIERVRSFPYWEHVPVLKEYVEKGEGILKKLDSVKMEARAALSSMDAEAIRRALDELQGYIGMDAGGEGLSAQLAKRLDSVRSFDAHLRRAQEASQDGLFTEALQAAEKALNSGIDEEQARIVYQKVERKARERAKKVKSHVKEALAKGDLREAKALLEREKDGLVSQELRGISLEVQQAEQLVREVPLLEGGDSYPEAVIERLRDYPYSKIAPLGECYRRACRVQERAEKVKGFQSRWERAQSPKDMEDLLDELSQELKRDPENEELGALESAYREGYLAMVVSQMESLWAHGDLPAVRDLLEKVDDKGYDADGELNPWRSRVKEAQAYLQQLLTPSGLDFEPERRHRQEQRELEEKTHSLEERVKDLEGSVVMEIQHTLQGIRDREGVLEDTLLRLGERLGTLDDGPLPWWKQPYVWLAGLSVLVLLLILLSLLSIYLNIL
ncbi:MAG: protein kinase [Anaerolineae bacterium]